MIVNDAWLAEAQRSADGLPKLPPASSTRQLQIVPGSHVSSEYFAQCGRRASGLPVDEP